MLNYQRVTPIAMVCDRYHELVNGCFFMGYLYINFWTTWNWETRILVGWVGLGLGPSFMWGDMIYISDYQFCIFETRLWFCLNIECSLWKQKHNDIELNRIYSLNIEQNNFIRIQNRMLFKFLRFLPVTCRSYLMALEINYLFDSSSSCSTGLWWWKAARSSRRFSNLDATTYSNQRSWNFLVKPLNSCNFPVKWDYGDYTIWFNGDYYKP